MPGAVSGLAEFRRQVQGFVKDTKRLVQSTAVDLAIYSLHQILKESPQFTGDFVANWQVGYSNAKFKRYVLFGGNDPRGDDFEPFQKGDPEAIEYALNKLIPQLNRLRKAPLGTAVVLTNSAVHDEPYAWKIEDGSIKFRAVNKPGDRPVARAAYMARNRFKHIGKTQLDFLKRFGV